MASLVTSLNWKLIELHNAKIVRLSMFSWAFRKCWNCIMLLINYGRLFCAVKIISVWFSTVKTASLIQFFDLNFRRDGALRSWIAWLWLWSEERQKCSNPQSTEKKIFSQLNVLFFSFLSWTKVFDTRLCIKDWHRIKLFTRELWNQVELGRNVSQALFFDLPV